MAFATARSLALKGADGHVIDVQVDVSPGLVNTTIVGRVDKSLSEARDRVRMAINNDCGRWPATKRVTILLAPADLPKSGTHYDLAIAIAVMAADKKHEELSPEQLDGWAFIGELSVSGALRPVPGVLPMVIAAASHGITRVFVPEPQAAEAALVPGMTVFGVRSLAQVSAVLRDAEVPEADPVVGPSASPLATWRGDDRLADLDLLDLDGLEDVRYAVEVAAAGGHPMMLIGPRGTGKTSIAERIPSILPDLTTEQALEVTALHSVAGTLPEGSGLLRRPPWFAPHHSATAASVLGGGTGRVRPGQVSLAHHGVLFLDEFPHFRADVIEAMRQPLESGEVTIARGEEAATYPARSLVVLAANPCPCGNFHGLSGGSCDCTEVQRTHYRRKLTGPILDRVDIWMEVRPQGRRAGSWGAAPESSADVRARVTEARQRQARRFRDRSWQLNASCPGPALTEHWPLEPEGQRLIDQELSAGRLTRRGLTRVQRLAWSVADCAGVGRPGEREAEIALALRSDDPARSLPARAVRVAS
ncbi:magnesium chelatase [Nocardioides sp. Root122]|uniref:YifB family Mg chelatase-like AAA ATPase n=1 Tax=Nocardioides TaxID=1839 RepID=UPI0007030412|nr:MULTISPECIES: YifB family Mg chelatase-like AAA ATPase [Nocardioides]KQV72858.1 magnesium chelatase [Nocardioides sp. Root122]MCK9825671.1 YifB family Mg chelatase-like AAA ATPase [Nocardioides cavernae]